MVTLLAYDGEGRLSYYGTTTWAGAEYFYNALGERVERYNGSLGWWETIWSDPWGHESSVIANGIEREDYLPPVAGRQYAMYIAGDTYFMHPNALGSTGMLTDHAGAAAQEVVYYPFGSDWMGAGTSPTAHYLDARFASMQPWDPQTPEIFFSFTPNRVYGSQWLSRWITPDSLGGDVTNPQSLNRYAYVLNNPTNFIDPLGLDCERDFPGQFCIDFTATSAGSGGGFSNGGSGGFVGAGGAGPGGLRYPPLQDNPDPPGRGPGGLLSPFGIRSGNQTYSQCLSANKNTYSIGGAIELTADVAFNKNTNISEKTNFLTGNGITNLFFDGPGAGDFLNIASSGAGSPLTFGRRTSDILSLNLAGKGGLPRALGSSGAKGFLESAGRFLNLGLDEAEKFAVDAGLAGAEAINCAIPAGNLVP